MYDCEIAGQTDFFYGFGTCWVTNSNITLRGCGGGITAWKGTNTTFENKYGVYIDHSVVRKANSSLEIEGECALGRPWNALHRSIFANTYLDDSIRPSGYIEWGTTDTRVNQSKFRTSFVF
jgi:pectin methylesterase-like acyl-CoA thioesterase